MGNDKVSPIGLWGDKGLLRSWKTKQSPIEAAAGQSRRQGSRSNKAELPA